MLLCCAENKGFLLIRLAACLCSVGQMELLFFLKSVLQSAGIRFSAALSLHMEPEWSRAGVAVWALGIGLSPVQVQLLGLQTGNKGVRGSWEQRRAGKAS